MGFLGIVPDKIVHKIKVEFLGMQYALKMPINKLVLDQTVEAFYESITLRMMRITPKMFNLVFLGILSKVFMELSSVIGLNGRDGKRSHLNKLF